MNIEASNAVKHKPKVVVTGDCLLNQVHEKGLSKNHNVKVNNFAGGTSQVILENLDNLLLNKPDC